MKRIHYTTETFKNLCNEVHNHKYDYSLLQYKTLHDSIIVICPEHGQFNQLANHHKKGSGCRKCSTDRQILKQRDTTEGFINKAISVHGNKYDYSETIYGASAHEKVKIVCYKHGPFYQSPNAHLRNGGCDKCGIEKSVQKLKENNYPSWSRTNWRKRCEGKIPKLYKVRFWSDSEEFIKIGITSKDSIKRRFTKVPYQYEILKIITSHNPDYIFDLERRFLRFTSKSKYVPKIKFEGHTECRTLN